MAKLLGTARGKRILGLIAILLVIAIAVMIWGDWLSARGRESSIRNSFSSMPVDRGDIQQTVSATGQLVVGDQRNIESEITGTVRNVYVKEGDEVSEGQPLFDVENDDVLLEVEQARIELQLAQQELADLLGVTADQAMAAAVASSYNLTTDQSGRVTEVLVKQGQSVSQGTPIISLIDDREILFVAKVNEPEMRQIRVGQAATVRTDGFAPDDLPGKVVSVDTKGTAENGTILYQVEIALQNPGALQEGMTGWATIQTPSGTVLRSGSYQHKEAHIVKATQDGVVDDVSVSVNDWVDAGKTIAAISNDNLLSNVTRQKLRVQQAERNLQNKEEQLQKLQVVAPVAGTVSEVNIAPGDLVRGVAGGSSGDSSNALVTINPQNRMEVTIPVDELDIVHIQEGQTAEIRVPAIPDQRFKGTVTKIASSGQGQNGVATFDVTVSVENPERLRPGMTAEVSIVIAEKKNVLRVPSEAVTVTGDGGMVQVLENGQPTPRQVSVGLRTDRWTEILDGLTKGEQVVVATGDSTTGNSMNNRMPMGPGIRGPVMRQGAGPGRGGGRP